MKIFISKRHSALRVLALACLSATSFGGVHAQITTDSTTQSTTQSATALPPVVITATRFSSLLDESINDVRTIDRSTLEKWSGSNLNYFLAREVGFDIKSDGGAGQLNSMFLRGLDPRHTMLLIDGVRYGSISQGGPIWQQIPMDLIEKIEIVRSPASSIYGSEAAAGVVQIFTRRSAQDKQPFQPFASIGFGSYNRQKYNLGAQGGNGQWEYFVAIDGDKENSFSATNDQASPYSYNPDSDPYRSHSLHTRIGYRFNEDYQLQLGAGRSRGVNHFDDGPSTEATQADIGNDFYNIKLIGDITPKWRTEITLAQSENLYTHTLSASAYSATPSTFDSKQQQIILQNHLTTEFGELVLGADKTLQSLYSTTAFDKTTRTINAMFVGWQHKIGAHRLQANIRNDENSQFGNATTYSLGHALRFAEQWQTRLTYGTFFTVPDFNRLYYPGYANPNLQPEKGDTAEAGVDWLGDNSSVKLTYYETHINNYFVNDENYVATNGGRAKVSGVELGYDWQMDAWRIKAGGHYMDARDKISSKLLPWRAATQLYTGVEYDNKVFSTGVHTRYVSSRYNDAANTEEKKLGEYTLVDTFVRYPFGKEWVAQLQVNNVLNKTYQTQLGYQQAGRNGLVSVAWQGW